MNLDWSDDELDFRHELRGWLQRNLAGRHMSVYAADVPTEDLRDWEATLANAGLNAVSWPAEFGGGGFSRLRAVIFNEEYERAAAPRRLNFPALGLLGPTLMATGTEQQQRTLLPRILACDDVWCQGFSEPDAGSDLASLRTRADRDGDYYVVNGQKTWCTNAGRANHIFCLVRTDQRAPKRKGISYLLIDLSLPGVEVCPIRQINGANEFAEVFFTDVRVPVECRIGDENDGWRVARTTLGIERDASRYPAMYFERILAESMAILEARQEVIEPEQAIEIARLQAAIDCHRLNYYASATSERPSSRRLDAIAKLCRSELQTQIYELGMRALGDDLELGPATLPDGVGRDWHVRYWHARASHIYAGTNQIQRTIIGERLLSLPREPQLVRGA
jgi:alkylation response protein AidB-like acyl-CoA dehydrogenase